MPPSFRELARYRAEDAVPFRSHLLTLLLDENDRILVKADIGAVLAGEGLRLAHDNCAEDVLLLHRLPGGRSLDRNDNDVPDTRVAAPTERPSIPDQAYDRIKRIPLGVLRGFGDAFSAAGETVGARETGA